MSTRGEDGEPTSGGALPGTGQSLRARASRGTLVSLAGQGASQLLRLGGNLLLARLLFPEAFGLMAIVYLVIFALEQISNIGIGAAVMRFERGEQPEFLNTAWTLQIVRGVGLWLIALALTPVVADFYRLPELRSILPVASLAAVLIGFSSTKLLVLYRRLDLTRLVAIEFSGQCAALLVMIAIAYTQRSVWALVLGGLANQAVVLVLSHVAIPGPRNRVAWNADDARSIYSIGKWVIASSGVSFLLAQIDIALLGRLIPAAVLGVYSMGLIIPNLLRDVAFRLSSSVLAPIVAESNRQSPAMLRERYAAARRLTLPTALLTALGAAALGPAFFAYLYDARYHDAGWICQLALLRFWFAYLQVSGCLTLLSIGHGREWAISNLVGLAGSTTGCLVGFQLGELPGLLVGMAIGTALGAAVPILRLQQLGIASPLPELRYTALGLCLALLLVAVSGASSLIPIADPALRTLIGGGIALSPYALWALFRILPEIRTL
ncbi:MAG: oligosaccharide flippase family protein [Myxococcota bacterium]